MQLPRDWYDLEVALKNGVVTLVANKRALILALVWSYAVTLGAFGGLCFYYLSQTTVDFKVSQVHELPGYTTCQPMQRDPQYGLLITYDECMSTYYRAPSVDDLRTAPDSHYGPLRYAFNQTATTKYGYGWSNWLQHWDGPWNFTPTASEMGTRDGRFPKADHLRLAYHHIPFPFISSMSYTVNNVCRVPYYDGFENHPQYSNASLDDLLRFPIERAVANNEGNHVGYGWYGLTNIDLNVSAQVNMYDWPSPTKNVFKLTAGTEFVSQCGGNFTSTFQSRVDVNGTFVFPFAHGDSFSVWWKTPSFEDRSIQMRKGTIAMTPMYPIFEREYSIGSTDTYFGAPRCEYYERETVRQAFEYVYSKPNCHPCDSFKFNSPFVCERTVRKTVGEVIALATSNALAILATFITCAPIVLTLGGVKKQGPPAATQDESPATQDES
jgi:hypothetical protein